MTTEGKLKAIISAQVKGGCEKYKVNLKEKYEWALCSDAPLMFIETKESCKSCGFANHIDEDDYIDGRATLHILEILLDKEGLVAAYGDKPFSGGFFAVDNDLEFTAKSRWRQAGHEILELWFSGGWEAAINVAYDLLPKS